MKLLHDYDPPYKSLTRKAFLAGFRSPEKLFETQFSGVLNPSKDLWKSL